MKLKVQNDPKEEIAEQKEDETLPPVEEETGPEADSAPEPEVSQPQADPTESLKLELAELKGQLSILKDQKKETPQDSDEQKAIQTKQRVLADANSLDDDQFQQIYKMTKLQAVHSVTDYELTQERLKNSVKMAEMEAKSELIAKYPSFSKNYDKLKSVISDLSPEAKKDPERVKKALEKEYLYISQSEKQSAPLPPKKESDMNRRKIVNDFERPSLNPNRTERKVDDDLIQEEDRELAAHFGLTKESDRKKFTSPYIPMEFGVDPRDGKRVIFEDPRKGIVKIANT